MKLKKYLFVFIILLAGIETRGELSSPKYKPAGINALNAVNRAVSIFPNVVIVKRKPAGLMRNRDAMWKENLEKINALSVESLFPEHQGRESKLSEIVRIQLIQGSDVSEAIDLLSHDSYIEWAEPVYPQTLCYDPNDATISNQWYLDKIKASQAWDQFNGDTTVVIGIIDTGVNLTHPDLSANIWRNRREIPADGIDNDGNQFIDDVHGWDFGVNDNNPNPSESIAISEILHWHGTAVSGVASAVTDNGIGMAAPAFNAKIMAVKVMNEEGIIWSDISSRGIVYAVDNGAHIINTSFGGPASNALLEAVNYANEKNVLVVAAAGNENSDLPIYPAGYPTVLSVAALDQNDQRAIFNFTQASNYGYAIDVSAPGIQIYTTWSDAGYAYLSGTSLSTPLVASIAALLKGAHPQWNAEQIREQIRISSDPIDALNTFFERKLGYGRVNADRVLRIDMPAIRLTEVNIVEDNNANNDGIFDPGEKIAVTFKVQNFLQPATNIQLNFETDNPDITLLNSFFSLSNLGTLEEWNNSGNPMRIEIDPGALRGQKVDVLLNISLTGEYQDYDYFNFLISPIYATIQGANVRLTLSSDGKLGFIDYPYNEEGEGFVFGDRGNLLFEGAVMAATAPDSVSDVARGLDSNQQNSDFYSVPDGEIVIRRPGNISDEQGKAIFTDESSPLSLNLKITQTTMAFDDSLHGDYILIKYKIENIFTDFLHGLYFGLFLDWDIDNVFANSPGFDPDFSMGYIFDPTTSIFGGCEVVSQETGIAYRSILNEEEIYPDAGGYADGEKWAHLSGGIQPIGKMNPGDYSHVLGVGPIDLSPGDSALVGFALLGGEGLDELKENALRAREKWQTLFETADIQPLIPELGNNYPNPFNESTNIHYEITEKSHVMLTVYNLIGQEIVRLVDEIQEPGRYQTQWNGVTIQGRAASGIYCYKLKAGSFEQVHKMVLIR